MKKHKFSPSISRGQDPTFEPQSQNRRKRHPPVALGAAPATHFGTCHRAHGPISYGRPRICGCVLYATAEYVPTRCLIRIAAYCNFFCRTQAPVFSPQNASNGSIAEQPWANRKLLEIYWKFYEGLGQVPYLPCRGS